MTMLIYGGVDAGWNHIVVNRETRRVVAGFPTLGEALRYIAQHR